MKKAGKTQFMIANALFSIADFIKLLYVRTLWIGYIEKS
jgi:hypothetical protein